MDGLTFLKKQIIWLPVGIVLALLIWISQIDLPQNEARPAALNLVLPTATPPFIDEAGKVTIQVVGRRGTETDGLRQIIGQWEAKTGHRVALIELPFDYLQQKIFTDVWSGAGEYDVMLIDDPWFPALASSGYLTPLGLFGYEPDPDFVRPSLEVCMWPPPRGPRPPGTSTQEISKLYALPLVGNVQVVWYRKDLISSADQSAAALIQQLSDLTDPEKGIYGYAYRGAGGNALVAEFNAWNWAYGGDIFDENWQVIINQPPTQRALEDFLRATKLASPAAASFTSGDITNSLLAGETLAAVTWPTENKKILDNNLSDKIGVITFPEVETKTSQLGNWLMAIPTASKHKQVAYDFMIWATSAPVMKAMAQHSGTPPTRTSVFNDPDLQAEFWWFPTTEQALRQSTWRPRTPEWNKIVNIISDYLSEAIKGNLSANEALNFMQQDIEDLMEQQGYLQP